MELPDDILTLIREFTKPITYAGWRKLHIMTNYQLLKLIADTYQKMNLPVINSFVARYEMRQKYMQYRYSRSRQKFTLSIIPNNYY